MSARRVLFACTLVSMGLGCSSPAPAPTPPPPAPAVDEAGTITEAAPAYAAPLPPAAAATPSASSGTVLAHIEVVDRAGTPLAGMAPVVSRNPNAFEAPVADGALTGPDGKGSVRAPADEHLYLRAWDPKMDYFANNYYDLLPGGVGETESLRITMVESGGFAAEIHAADGSPLAGTEVRALLVYPSAGPWWPIKAVTDDTGKALFKPVPAGQFGIRLGTADSVPLDVPSLLIPPGEVANAGTLSLPQ